MFKRVLTAAAVAGLLWWERKRSLRRVVDSKLRRDARNLAMAGLAAGVVQLLEMPVAMAIARQTQRRNLGLLQMVPLFDWAKPLVAILLLDYTLYIWHRLTHRVPLLWRFHRVHHVDREMDASTALRFHFGEIALSVAFRAAQMYAIGPAADAYVKWQTILIGCILFHHANILLPVEWEKRIATILMTPRLHGIHHSVVEDEMNSNWSSGLTLWDWLHGTLRASVPQESIVIGVEGYRSDEEQALPRLIVHPFIYDATRT